MDNFASSIRPTTLKEVVGQNHIKPLLEKIVEKKEFVSLLFYGKPGIGKTSLAYALANDLKITYTYFNAAIGNKKEFEELIKINDCLIIDEIHRLNKDKQDILLPAIEQGRVQIMATTTENPFFVVNPAVRSRMHILELKELSEQDIVEALKNIIETHKLSIKINDNLLKHIAAHANGDFRYAINVLNLLAKLYKDQEISPDILKTVMPSLHFFSDKNGDGHYDLLSAFHKSLRGSDVDASLYYLARLILSGDILGMERRMLAVAYEDIGLANPNVALRVSNAIDVTKKLGFPEGELSLANAVIDLCQAEKSNSATLAIKEAMALAREKNYEIPAHLKDSHYVSSSKLGRGVGYKYPHDYGGYVEQQYLPNEIKDVRFYKPNKNDKIK